MLQQQNQFLVCIERRTRVSLLRDVFKRDSDEFFREVFCCCQCVVRNSFSLRQTIELFHYFFPPFSASSFLLTLPAGCQKVGIEKKLIRQPCLTKPVNSVSNHFCRFDALWMSYSWNRDLSSRSNRCLRVRGRAVTFTTGQETSSKSHLEAEWNPSPSPSLPLSHPTTATTICVARAAAGEGGGAGARRFP